MIRGFLREEAGRRRPFVSAVLEIPSLQCWGDLAFLVDTGADGTLLSPRDAALLGIDERSLPAGPPSTGIGGRVATVHVQATIILNHLSYDVPLRILAPRTARQRNDLARIPSLLGRDVLAHLALYIEERSRRVLLLEPAEVSRLQLP
jgi:predicted aspartyl protease